MPVSQQPLHRVEHSAPASLSVYRGQSRRGIGEGPGLRVAHGEQYLHNTAAELQNVELLDRIRPWMTLDSDPADHHRLEDQLEAWSCFSEGGHQFVVRLVSAGTYSHRRAAYFAHGRGWRETEWPLGFDPGAHLGRSEVFEEPWRDDEEGRRVAEVPPAMARPEQVKAEPDVAARFLAHLYQALIVGYPLIVAAPVPDFRRGSALHALISFARAALPAELKRRCRVRVYSHHPEVFLRQLGTDLLVVPDAVAGEALATSRSRKPVLLTRQGEIHTGEVALDDRALSYARAVVIRARKLPQGLLLFSERYRDLAESHDLDTHLPITYNLAYAMAEEKWQGLLGYLLSKAQKSDQPLPWESLIHPEEWELFPSDELLDLAFRDAEGLNDRGRDFQERVRDEVLHLGLETGEYLDGWWDAEDTRKQDLLLELLATRPGLVADPATYLSHVPLDRIAARGRPVHGVLAAELEAGTIGRRAKESVELGKLAHRPEVREVLSRATFGGQLDPGWAWRYVRAAADGELVAMAETLLERPARWKPWDNVPKELFEALRKVDAVPETLRPAICRAGEVLDPFADFDTYLRLADVLARLGGANPLIDRLLAKLRAGDRPPDRRRTSAPAALPLSKLELQKRDFLIGIALSDEWRCLDPRVLVDDGRLPITLLPYSSFGKFAGRVLASADFCEVLDTSYLLRLANGLPPNDEESFRRLYELLDRRFRMDPLDTTTALLEQNAAASDGKDVAAGKFSFNWWWSWRQSTRLSPSEQREVALQWLGSEVWQYSEAPEPTVEEWERVVADLELERVSGEEMNRVCSTGSQPVHDWPWITSFEKRQLDDLCRLGGDLGALAELAENIQESDIHQPLGSVGRYVLAMSTLRDGLPEYSLRWLQGSGASGPPLNIEQAEYILDHAGHRQIQANEALLGTIGTEVSTNTGAAIDAAQQHQLFYDPSFLDRLREWLVDQSPSTMELVVATKIDRILAEINPRITRDQSKTADRYLRAAREFAEDGTYPNIAEFLYPDIRQRFGDLSLPKRIIEALARNSPNDLCWEQAAEKDRQPSSAARHPLSVAAERIRSGKLRRETVEAVRKNGWQTFQEALTWSPGLLAPDSDTRGAPALPALELTASLLGDGAVGCAAQRLIYVNASYGSRGRVDWWRALLGTILNYSAGKRRSSEFRDELALRLVYESFSGHDDYGYREFRQAVAAELESSVAWGTLLEFEGRVPTH